MSSRGVDLPDYQKQFMGSLECLMEQCYKFIEIQKTPPMTEQQRLAKIRALAGLIQDKEKELVDLEAQRAALSTLSSPGSQRTGQSSGFQCEPDCAADCRFKDKVGSTTSTSK